MDRLKKHQRMAESFHERLRGKGITLLASEIAVVAGMIREEILHRYVIARARIDRLRRRNGIKEKIVDPILMKLEKSPGT